MTKFNKWGEAVFFLKFRSMKGIIYFLIDFNLLTKYIYIYIPLEILDYFQKILVNLILCICLTSNTLL